MEIKPVVAHWVIMVAKCDGSSFGKSHESTWWLQELFCFDILNYHAVWSQWTVKITSWWVTMDSKSYHTVWSQWTVKIILGESQWTVRVATLCDSSEGRWESIDVWRQINNGTHYSPSGFGLFFLHSNLSADPRGTVFLLYTLSRPHWLYH